MAERYNTLRKACLDLVTSDAQITKWAREKAEFEWPSYTGSQEHWEFVRNTIEHIQGEIAHGLFLLITDVGPAVGRGIID